MNDGPDLRTDDERKADRAALDAYIKGTDQRVANWSKGQREAFKEAFSRTERSA